MLFWWESLTVLQKIFIALAVPSTLILILQSLMVLIGLAGDSGGDIGDSGDGDMDFADDLVDDIDGGDNAHESHIFGEDSQSPAQSTGLSLFTIRGITAFFSVGGWMGLTLTGRDVSPLIAIPAAFAAGTVALVGIAYIFKGILLLQDGGGGVEAENAIGKTAQVYLTIPANNLGKGKVTLVVQEKYVEFDACTRSGNAIKTGETVHVVDVLDDNMLVVEQTIFNKDPNLTVKR